MPFLLFACGVGILFFALVQLLTAGSQPLRNYMLVGCFGAACIMLCLWAAATGAFLRVPVLANSDIAVKFPTAAGFYLAALTILHEGRRPVRSVLAYLAVAVLLATGSLLYSALTAPAFLEAHGVLPGHYSNPVFATLTLLGDCAFLAACILNLLAARRLSRADMVKDRAGFRHQVVFLLAYLASAVLLVVSSALRDERLYALACLATGTIIVIFALSRTAVFYFARERDVPCPRARMPRWDHSAEDLEARLALLMEKETPYTDEALSLRKLAAMLGVEPKRLSYHLNLRHAKTFRSYINDMRLAAVCRDLADDPRRTILDTAFANGFNSKSSFNALFHRKYGRTPKEFRRAGAG